MHWIDLKASLGPRKEIIISTYSHNRELSSLLEERNRACPPIPDSCCWETFLGCQSLFMSRFLCKSSFPSPIGLHLGSVFACGDFFHLSQCFPHLIHSLLPLSSGHSGFFYFYLVFNWQWKRFLGQMKCKSNLNFILGFPGVLAKCKFSLDWVERVNQRRKIGWPLKRQIFHCRDLIVEQCL